VHPDTKVPAGVTTLGLLMQFAGGTGMVLAAFSWWLRVGEGWSVADTLLGGSFVVRAFLLRRAGDAMLYCPSSLPPGRLGALRKYVAFGLLHAGAMVPVLIVIYGAPSGMAFALSGALAIWPVVLGSMFSVSRPGRFAVLPGPRDDGGLGGAAIVMTMLGVWWLLMTISACGAVIGIIVDGGLSFISALGTIVVSVMAVISVLQLRAGLAGFGAQRFARAPRFARQYARASGTVLFPGLIALLMSWGGALAHTAEPGGIWTVAQRYLLLFYVVGCAVVIWPRCLEELFTNQHFPEDLDGHSDDQRLAGLGWVLVGLACFGVAAALVNGHRFFGSDVIALISKDSAIDVPFPWQIGLIALQGIAGVRLILQLSWRRAVAGAYGIAGAVIGSHALVQSFDGWPIAKLATHVGMAGVVVPVVTLAVLRSRAVAQSSFVVTAGSCSPSAGPFSLGSPDGI
jgi:hypothetical protein